MGAAVTSGAGAAGARSLWQDQVDAGGGLPPRPPLPADMDVDVAVVGGGFTGLWTAYSLLGADPSLRVVVLEAQRVGFGASGRNGGWCSSLLPTSTPELARRHGHEGALRLRRAMRDTVAEVARVVAAESIACDLTLPGALTLARNPAQLSRLRAALAADEAAGGIDGLRWLGEAEARARVGATGVLGGLLLPACARVQPARLVAGLAAAVERRGARIHEGTAVTRILPAGPGRRRPAALTDRGTVRADVVVRATEAWTATLPGSERDVVPLYSLMIATEPLPASFWRQAGLPDGQPFTDGRHLVIYGQRTADDRLAFGGRGAPYHLGSRISPSFDRHWPVFSALRRELVALFPALSAARITHAWGGPLGVPRRWEAGVGFDRSRGIAWAGGYVGDGVACANLAGRTLADLVLRRDGDVATLPWVNAPARRWEPEPLRWLGINAGLALTRLADAEEGLTRRPSLTAAAMAPLLGG